MIFSSVIFLLYFLPIFLLIYRFIPKGLKNPFLLLCSVFFYAWGAPKFIFVILGTTFVDFHLVKLMAVQTEKRKKVHFLCLSLFLNVGLLCYFKYLNFFIDNANAIMANFGCKELSWVKIVLPIGISFFTFESITYVVDAYRGIHKPLKNFWDYQLYIILFPKLIAGPIIRYHDLADQINNREGAETDDNRLHGFIRFCIGLGKKVLIANQMGMMADEIFGMESMSLGTAQAWWGAVAYTFQIYFDFSGYSDMAIGLAKIIGFQIPENFHNPFTAQSITDFWRKWHISLGAWMKNYLYIPLGGNRVGSPFRLYLNLWLVFLASGFWHGASWCFIFWGAYHGVWLILEKWFLLRLYAFLPAVLRAFITFFLVLLGWVFFRIEKMDQAFLYVRRMFSFHPNTLFSVSAEQWWWIFVAGLFSFFVLIPGAGKIQQGLYQNQEINSGKVLCTFVGLLLFLLSLSAITGSSFNPFIYFRF